MSNPYGNTGYREVKYVKPGKTIVYYNDRELTIETKGESNEDFASKVKARTGKVPEGYKTRAQAYAEKRAAAKKKREAALSQKRKASAAKRKSGTAKKGTTAPKTAAKSKAAPRTRAKAPRQSKPKANALEAGLASGKYVIE